MPTDILYLATQYTLYTGFITFVLGIVGNSLNILVFTQFKLFRDNRCVFYIIVESISNFIYQFVSISLTILTSIYGDDGTGRSPLWCKFRYIVAQTCVLTTIYMICFAAVDQFFSTNYHYNLRQMCTLKLARCLTTAFICVWTVHSIIFGLFVDIQPLIGCVISNPIWLQYSTYFFYPVLAGLLPISIAACFAILAYRNVRHIVRRQIPIVRRRLDRQMTAMILLRVIIFVSLVLPYTSFRIFVINFPIPQSEPMTYAIGRLVQAIFLSFVSLNYTVIFYMFLISSSRFRRQVKSILVKRCWQRWKAWFSPKNNQIAPDNTDSHDSNLELEEG